MEQERSLLLDSEQLQHRESREASSSTHSQPQTPTSTMASTTKRAANEETPTPGSVAKRIKCKETGHQEVELLPSRSIDGSQVEIHKINIGLYLEAYAFHVGPDRDSFHVHKNVLKARCHRYWNYLLDDYREEKEPMRDDAYQLPSVQPRTFKMFLSWLYTQEIPASPPYSREESSDVRLHPIVPTVTPEARWQDEDLVDLWTFGAENDIFELSNTALSCLAMQNDKHARTTSLTAVSRAFDGPEHRETLRNYLLDEAVFRLRAQQSQTISPHLTSFHAAYVAGIVKIAFASSTGRSTVQPKWQTQPCYYHSHSHLLEHQDANKACREYWTAPQGPKGGSRLRCVLQTAESFSDIVTISIGRERYRFTVHKRLICDASRFFESAFDGRFLEGTTNHLHLPTESVLDFAIFLHWLYTGKIDTPWWDEQGALTQYLARQAQHCSKREARTQRDEEGGSSHEHAALLEDESETPFPRLDTASLHGHPFKQAHWINMFMFADRRDVRFLRNQIMDRIVSFRSHDWALMSGNLTWVRHCFELLAVNSPLCRYLMQEAAYCWRPGLGGPKLLDDFPSLPPVFIAGVLKTIIAKRDTRLEFVPYFDRWKVQLCGFHDHDGDVEEQERCRVKHADWQRKLDDVVLQWQEREHRPVVVEDDGDGRSDTATDS